MVKLFSDEEMLERCKLYQPIPLDIEQKILHYEGDSKNINILNGVIPSPYKIGQPVDSIINYAHQLEYHLPVSAENFIQEYEKILEKEIKKETKQVMDELLERIEMEDIEPDYTGETARRDDMDSEQTLVVERRTRRTKQQMTEARLMGEEDKE